MTMTEEIDSRMSILGKGLIDALYGGLGEIMPQIMLKGLQTFTDSIKSKDVAVWSAQVDDWVEKKFIDVDTGEVLKELRNETEFLGAVTTLFVKIKMLMMVMNSSMDIATMDRQYDLISKTTPHPAPVENLIRSMILDPTRATENRTQLKRHGFDDTQIDNIILSHYNVVPEGAIRINWLRGNITTDKMYERMRELGFTDTRIKEIIQTWAVYPGPQDLFTMVAHEAFEPDIYGPLGLADEFPAEQMPWLEAQGISNEWALKYWISHWAQPSLGQGFEMLHRGVITKDELNMLFKVVEIPKFWREKLMAITYNPYTRVDARRMHDLGVLGTEELITAYQDIGYDAAHAIKMTEFTLRFNAEGDKQLTRGVILDSFRTDLISREDATALLIEDGYDKDLADFYLTNEEYKQALDIQKVYLGIIEDKFKLGMTNEIQTRTLLNKQNLRGSNIDALLDQWELEKYKYQAIPSPSQLDHMLIEKIISEGEWRELMTRHGYSYQHQGWLLEIIERSVTISQTLPTKSEIKSWYKGEFISEAQYRIEMKQLGYADSYINMYLKTM